MQTQKQGRFMSLMRLIVSASVPPLIALFIVNTPSLHTLEIEKLAQMLDSSRLFFLVSVLTVLLTLVYVGIMEMIANTSLSCRENISRHPSECFLYVLISTALSAVASVTLSFIVLHADPSIVSYAYVNFMILGALIGLLTGLVLLAIRFYAEAVIPSRNFPSIRRWHYS